MNIRDKFLRAEQGHLYLLGCSIGANISLGNNATAIDLGTRFALPDGTPTGQFAQLPGTHGGSVSGLPAPQPLAPEAVAIDSKKADEEAVVEQRVDRLEDMVAALARELRELKVQQQLKTDDVDIERQHPGPAPPTTTPPPLLRTSKNWGVTSLPGACVEKRISVFITILVICRDKLKTLNN
jgi:hypothetical protein